MNQVQNTAFWQPVFESLSKKMPGLAAAAMQRVGIHEVLYTSTSLGAPSCLSTLRLCQGKGRLLIWTGDSDTSIYTAPEVNHLARVWHDCTHLLLGADFDADGERSVAIQQAWGTLGLTTMERLAVFADTDGQREFYEKTGKFVDNQRHYVEDYMQRWL